MSQKPNRKTIADQVREAAEELRRLDGASLRDWAMTRGWDTGIAFARFRQALAEIGIDYGAVRPLSTSEAAATLGLTSDQFRRLAAERGVSPCGWYPNPHYRSAPDCPLWRREDVGRLRPAAAAFAAQARERAEAMTRRRREIEQRRRARFAARYASWRDALPDAAEALFSLNRYAKHWSCRRDHREEIYDLKNDLVELLYKTGFCLGAGKHVVPGWKEECWGCWGSGVDDDGEECQRCGGSGVWRRQSKRVFIVFRFRVGEREYTWHQPEELVTWRIQLTEGERRADLELEEKPVPLSPRKFAEAKALIRWVLDMAGADESRE